MKPDIYRIFVDRASNQPHLIRYVHHYASTNYDVYTTVDRREFVPDRIEIYKHTTLATTPEEAIARFTSDRDATITANIRAIREYHDSNRRNRQLIESARRLAT